jgi:hypothetical protein
MEPVSTQAATDKMPLSCYGTYDNKMGRKKIFIEILQTYILDCFDSIIEIKSDNIGTGASKCTPV